MKKNKILFITILSILFIISSWLYTYEKLAPLKFEERGTIGDMFGGLNTLFSGLAFCGIIVSILLQSSKLKMQRNEIAQNRVELKGTKEAQIKQSKSLERQAENLKISAKLSALNTLVNYYSEKSNINKTRISFQSHIDIEGRKAEKYLREIERLLENKNYS